MESASAFMYSASLPTLRHQERLGGARVDPDHGSRHMHALAAHGFEQTAFA